MHKTVFAISILFAMMGAAPGPGSSRSGPTDDPKRFCAEAVDLISQNDAKGFALLQERTLRPMPADDWKVFVRNNERKIDVIRGNIGQYLGNELVEERKVNDSLRKYVYIAKYDQAVIRWIFILYRPHDEWKLLQWGFDFGNESTDSLFRQ